MRRVLIIVFFIFCFIFLWNSFKLVPFHQDEFVFLDRSFTVELLVNKEFDHQIWSSYIGYDQPKLAEFVYGANLLYLSEGRGVKEYLSSYGFYDDKLKFGKEKWWVKSSGKEVESLSAEVQKKLIPVLESRRISLLLSFGCIILMFLIGVKLRGLIFGLLSAGLLFENRLFLGTALRAMADSFLLFFLLLTFYLSLFFIERVKSKKNENLTGLSVGIGMSTGLAMASKLNGGLGLIYFFILFIALMLFGRLNKEKEWRLIKALAIIIIALFLVFILFNPFTWGQPVKNSLFMFSHRINMGVRQGLYSRRLLVSLMDKLIGVYESVFSPLRDYGLLQRLFIGTAFFIIGLFTLVERLLKSKKANLIGQDLALVLWAVVVLITVVIYIPMDWERYYLPIFPGVILVQLMGIFGVVKWLRKSYEKK